MCVPCKNDNNVTTVKIIWRFNKTIKSTSTLTNLNVPHLLCKLILQLKMKLNIKISLSIFISFSFLFFLRQTKASKMVSLHKHLLDLDCSNHPIISISTM